MSDLHVWPHVSCSADRICLTCRKRARSQKGCFVRQDVIIRHGSDTDSHFIWEQKEKSHATWLVLARHAGVFIYSRKKAGTETVVCQQLSNFFSAFTWNSVGVKNALLLSHNKMQIITYHAELASDVREENWSNQRGLVLSTSTD